MSDVYESIVAGLQEAIEDAKSKEKKLPRRVVTVVPVKESGRSEKFRSRYCVRDAFPSVSAGNRNAHETQDGTA